MDKNRRQFLKIMLIGGGTLLVGKFFGPMFLKFLEKSFTETDSPVAKNTSSDFQVVENDNSMSIYDRSGEEVFQIDKGV